MRKPVEERFWSKVQKAPDDKCWIWKGATVQGGYGMIRDPEAGRNVLTHRFAYARFVADIPVGMQVLHRCDTPSCVRPDHLVLGSHSQNMEDMKRKGRARILSVIDVKTAIVAIGAGYSKRSVAQQLCVSGATLQRALGYAARGDYGPGIVVAKRQTKYTEPTPDQWAVIRARVVAGEPLQRLEREFQVDRKRIRVVCADELKANPRKLGRPRPQ